MDSNARGNWCIVETVPTGKAPAQTLTVAFVFLAISVIAERSADADVTIPGGIDAFRSEVPTWFELPEFPPGSFGRVDGTESDAVLSSEFPLMGYPYPDVFGPPDPFPPSQLQYQTTWVDRHGNRVGPDSEHKVSGSTRVIVPDPPYNFDTVVRRNSAATFTNPGDEAVIGVEMLWLSLKSVDPLEITFAGSDDPGDPPPKYYDIYVGLSAMPQVVGRMSATAVEMGRAGEVTGTLDLGAVGDEIDVEFGEYGDPSAFEYVEGALGLPVYYQVRLINTDDPSDSPPPLDNPFGYAAGVPRTSVYHNRGMRTTSVFHNPNGGEFSFSETVGFENHEWQLGGNPAAQAANAPRLLVVGNDLQLTSADNDEATGAFCVAPQGVEFFEAEFEYQLLAGTSPPADGVAFVIQNVGPSALGGAGGGRGYTGVADSVAVSLNLWQDRSDVDAGLNGAFGDRFPTDPVNLRNGNPHKVHISYDGVTLGVGVEDVVTGDVFETSWNVDVPAAVGDTAAYVGFTGGTGAANADQRIRGFWYTSTPMSTFTWNESGADSDWGSADNWSGDLPSFPGTTAAAIVGSANTGTVMVSAPQWAFTLTVDGGAVLIDSNQVLTATKTASFAPGTRLSLEHGARFITHSGLLNDVATDGDATIEGAVKVRGTLAPGSPLGTLSVDGDIAFLYGDGTGEAEYLVDLSAAGNDLVEVTGDAVLAGRLTPKAIASVGDLARQEWGVKTRTILSTSVEGGIQSEFDDLPDAGEHLGFGVFFEAIDYQPANTDLHVLQAAPGDTNGDREVNNSDLQEILGSGSFNQPPRSPDPWDWRCGDFDGNGIVNNSDLQLILATGLFGKGPYEAVGSGQLGGAGVVVPEPGTLAMLACGLIGLLRWRRRSRLCDYSASRISIFSRPVTWTTGRKLL